MSLASKHTVPLDLGGGWRGRGLRQLPPLRRADWPRLKTIEEIDWQAIWSFVLAAPTAGWEVFKQDHSGMVAAGTLHLAGMPTELVVKRPQRTRLGQSLVDPLRPSRARRAWRKTWALLSAGLPTELPLLVAERRKPWGTVEDQVALYARVPGRTVKALPLNDLPPDVRKALLEDVGHVLRRTADLGFNHIDAKTSNWVATPVEGGLRAVMLDCDGVRYEPWRRRRTRGLDRFLRALRDHPAATEADLDAVRTAFDSNARHTPGVTA